MTEKTIYQRMFEIMKEVEYIQKGDKIAEIGAQKYRFVSHDQVTAAIRPALIKHGVLTIPTIRSFSQDGNRTIVNLSVRFVNCDNPSDFVEIESLGYGVDSQDKGPGKAVSYAYKYAILKAFCIETGDDPDNDQKTEFKPSPKSSPKPEMTALRPTPLTTLNEPQIKMIQDLATPERIARICHFYKAKDLSEIEKQHFSEILSKLKKGEK
jgi:hypothetical protein